VLLETKLHAPGKRDEWVERSELIQRLAASRSARLILVDAPAGFGKTTLVAEWRASPDESRPFAWISLDRADNDPARLWWHVVSALQRACPDLDAGDTLRALGVQAPNVEGTLLLLLNELASRPAPAVLVLDDYHMIKDRGCHDQVAYFVRHVPPSLQLVLITRADPPLPLARLRAAGDMAEIRMRDLRFTTGEAAALVDAVSSTQLDERDVADLVERTEGWPAGVYLAALSLRSHPSPRTFIRQFSGSNRYVVDFLADEVLSRQPNHVRQFLARTSILDRFTAPLCDAVVGPANSAEIIDILERENLFVVALDDDRRWFRYHHLFAQMIRGELARSEPGIIPGLHERASAWHRASGMVDEAIKHAIAAGDATGTVDLIARYWLTYVTAAQIRTVCAWLRSLGDQQIAADPVAAHAAAWAAALCGERESTLRWLGVVEAGEHQGPLPDGMRSLESSAALLRATFGFDGIRVMRESAERAVQLETDPTSPWFALATGTLGFGRYLCGELQAATAPLEAAALNESSSPLVHALAFSVLTLVTLDQGRLEQAAVLARMAREMLADGADVDRSDIGESPHSSLIFTATGAVYAAQGRPEEARRELEHALWSRRRWFVISPWPSVEALLRLACVLLDIGDRGGAATLLAEADNTLTAFPDGTEAQRARLERIGRRLPPRAATVPHAESLTEREEAVLRLLRGTLSLREIGQELHLSANTIKTHTRAVYRKLGVAGRREAIQQGRVLGIL